MRWIDDFNFFLFDFDGLLVNTEELHYEAYRQMCASQGFHLPWTFTQYTHVAHLNSENLRQQTYAQLPGLYAKQPDWEQLVVQKKRLYLELISKSAVTLMPGVAALLQTLFQKGKKFCVVTNSPLDQVHTIRTQQPVLELIPHWLTREDYTQPKPHPEGYLKAISKWGSDKDKIVGFEDTPRGLKALLQTPAKAVLVSSDKHPALNDFASESYLHVPSFLSLKNICL